VFEPRPRAQYATSVSVWFQQPRERKHKGITVAPDDHRYFTIERDGEVLYDSRSDVRSTDDNPSA
jgi:hypothetical protein